MGTKGRAQPRRSLARWFDHRELLLVEAVLLLGLLEELLQAWILARPDLPPLVRVLSGMALSVGWLGGVTLLVRRHLTTGLKLTHAVVAKRPVPQLAVHGLALALIVLAYAWFWNDETGALADLARLPDLARAGITEAIAAD